jgi:transposase-like protein
VTDEDLGIALRVVIPPEELARLADAVAARLSGVAVEEEATRNAGPIPPAVPGKRRAFDAEQIAFLVAQVDRSSIARVAAEHDIAPTVLRRMVHAAKTAPRPPEPQPEINPEPTVPTVTTLTPVQTSSEPTLIPVAPEAPAPPPAPRERPKPVRIVPRRPSPAVETDETLKRARECVLFRMCPLCADRYPFPSEKRLDEHVRLQHVGRATGLRWVCSCGERFAKPAEHVNHRITRPGQYQRFHILISQPPPSFVQQDAPRPPVNLEHVRYRAYEEIDTPDN